MHNRNPGELKPDRLAKGLFILLIIAAILNGAAFWLKRVGWLEPQMYQAYMDFLGPVFHFYRTPEENEQLRVLVSGFYQSHGAEYLLKIAKDLWLVLFAGVSIYMMRHKGQLLIARLPWLLWFFLLLLGVSALQSVIRFGPVMTLAGLRFFSFVFLAMVAAWAVKREHLDILATWLFILLFIQYLLVPIELYQGLHMFGARFFGMEKGDRIVGTLLQPSSLGITAVLCLVFYMRFSLQQRWLIAVSMVTAVLVFFSASAMAILLLFFVVIGYCFNNVKLQYRVWFKLVGAGLFILLILNLPEISGRWNVMDSLWGRLLPIFEYVQQASVTSLLMGHGLGVGTNTAANLLKDWQTNQAPGFSDTIVFIADATPTALLVQIGVLGLLLFYALLAYAAWRDHQAALFYVIASIASVSTNITELFPVNMLLGLLFARSLFLQREWGR